MGINLSILNFTFNFCLFAHLNLYTILNMSFPKIPKPAFVEDIYADRRKSNGEISDEPLEIPPQESPEESPESPEQNPECSTPSSKFPTVHRGFEDAPTAPTTDSTHPAHHYSLEDPAALLAHYFPKDLEHTQVHRTKGKHLVSQDYETWLIFNMDKRPWWPLSPEDTFRDIAHKLRANLTASHTEMAKLLSVSPSLLTLCLSTAHIPQEYRAVSMLVAALKFMKNPKLSYMTITEIRLKQKQAQKNKEFFA